MRGGPIRERSLDGRDDAIEVAQNIVVPEADDAPALYFEVAGPGFVVGGALAVLAAIDFDDELFGAGGEVGDVRTYSDLSVEADA